MREASILIVDDIPANIKLLSIVLKKEGYSIFEATDGFTACEVARESQPTLILLDIMMPEIDGFETCEMLKHDERTKHIPVIFVTAKTEDKDKVRGLRMGAVDYITKPFHKSEVLVRVRNHMDLALTKQELVEREQMYHALVENIGDGVFLWHHDKGIVFSNSMFARMIGVDVEELMGADLKSVLDQGTADSILFEFTVFSEDTAITVKELDITFINKAGEVLRAFCSLAKINRSEENAIIVTVRDLTDRFEMERQLRQAQKLEAVGTLTSGIAHDFNNVLAIINGYAELAMMDAGDNEELLDKLSLIFSAGKSAISLTRGLLSFANGKDLLIEHADLGSEVKSISNFMRHSLPVSIEMPVMIPVDPMYCQLDVGMFQQIIVNLCINARDAMPHGGEISIALDEVRFDDIAGNIPEFAIDSDYVHVVVSDTGTGIPKNILDKIFTPFFTTKETGRGSGLGLAMVARIVRSHNGWIDVESIEGVGTTFSIYLPKIEGHSGTYDEYSHTFNDGFNPVLVVDDDEIQGNMVRFFLEKEGYDVRVVKSAEEALDLVEGDPDMFKLAVVDNLMPQMSGAELCRKVESGVECSMKTIVMSGGACIPLVGNERIKKPFTRQVLLRAIDKIS